MPVAYYRGLFIENDGVVAVLFPDLPGCLTQGDTIEEAAVYAEEALSLNVEGMQEDGDPLPSPSPIGGEIPDWMVEILDGSRYFERLVKVEISGPVSGIDTAEA